MLACPDDPEALFLEALEALDEVSLLRDGHVRDRTGRGLVRRRGHARAAAVGNEHARRTDHVGGAHDCPEIAGIGYMVARDDERVFGIGRPLDELVQAHVLVWLDLRDDALVGTVRRMRVELLARRVLDADAICLRTRQQL